MSYGLVINKLKQNNNQVWYVLDAYDYKDYLIDPVVLIKQSSYDRENYIGWATYSFPNTWKSLGIAPNVELVHSLALEEHLPKSILSNATLVLNDLALMPKPDGFVIGLPVPIFKKDGNDYVLLTVKRTNTPLSTKAVRLNNGDELVLARHECIIEIDVESKKGKKGGGVVQQPVHLYALRAKFDGGVLDLIDRDEFMTYSTEYNAQCPDLTFPAYIPQYSFGGVLYGWEDFWTVPPFDVVDRLKQYLESRFSRPVRLLLYVVDVDLRVLLTNLLGDNPANTTDEKIEEYFNNHLGYILFNDFVEILNDFVSRFDALLFQDFASSGNFVGLTTPHSNYTQQLYENITHANKVYLASYSGTFSASAMLQSPIKNYFSQGAVFTPPYVMCEECANDVRYYSPLSCDHGELYYNLNNRPAEKCGNVYRDLLNNLYQERTYNYKSEVIRQRSNLLLTQHWYKGAIGVYEFPNKNLQKSVVVLQGERNANVRFGMMKFAYTPTEQNTAYDYLIEGDTLRVMQRSLEDGAFYDLFIIYDPETKTNIALALRVENAVDLDTSSYQLSVDYILGDLSIVKVTKTQTSTDAVWEIETNKGTLTYSKYYTNEWGTLSIPFSSRFVRVGFLARVGEDYFKVGPFLQEYKIDDYYHFSRYVGEAYNYPFHLSETGRLICLVFFTKALDRDRTPAFSLSAVTLNKTLRSGYLNHACSYYGCRWVNEHDFLATELVIVLDDMNKFEVRDETLRQALEHALTYFSGENLVKPGPFTPCAGHFYPFNTSNIPVSDTYVSLRLSDIVSGATMTFIYIMEEQLAPYYQLFSLYSASKVLRNKVVYLSSFYLSPIEYFLAQNVPKIWFPFNWLYHQATYQLTDEENRCCFALRRGNENFPEPPEDISIFIPQPNTISVPVYSEELQSLLSGGLIQPFTHSSGKFFEYIPDSKTDLSLSHKKVPFLSYLQASPFAVITNDAGQWLGEIVKTEQGKYYIVVPTDYTDIVSQFIELGFAEYVEKEEGSTVLVIRNPFVLTTILKQSDGKFCEIPNVRIRLVDIS